MICAMCKRKAGYICWKEEGRYWISCSFHFFEHLENKKLGVVS